MTEDKETQEVTSCETSFTRAQFLKRVVKGAALTGGLLAAPKVLDKFLIPPAFAGASTCTLNMGTTNNGHPDTVVFDPFVGHLEVQCNNQTSNLTACSMNADSTLTCQR